VVNGNKMNSENIMNSSLFYLFIIRDKSIL